ncbi:MAG: TIGR04282 family arsenosugar biosynthesis glycosyltransferase [Mobilitalea sp.]
MKTAIAIFCKTPGLSPIKTRLSDEIGRKNAEDFYQLSLFSIKETVHRVLNEYKNEVDAYWAVAEKEAVLLPLWSSFQCIWTGEGSLGERIYHIYEKLLPLYDQVIIIGSDSPQITVEYLMTAIDKLSQNNLDGILGPCRDGGFVLFGGKKLIQESTWTEIVYSREDTLKQLKIRLDQLNYGYQMIAELGDVDTYEDLIMLVNDYLKLGTKIQHRQKTLFNWLQEILISKTLYLESQLIYAFDER